LALRASSSKFGDFAQQVVQYSQHAARGLCANIGRRTELAVDVNEVPIGYDKVWKLSVGELVSKPPVKNLHVVLQTVLWVEGEVATAFGDIGNPPGRGNIPGVHLASHYKRYRC